MKLLSPLVLALAFTAGPVLADTTVSGVKYEDSADVKGAKVQLNGAGTRYKAVFTVTEKEGKRIGVQTQIVDETGQVLTDGKAWLRVR